MANSVGCHTKGLFLIPFINLKKELLVCKQDLALFIMIFEVFLTLNCRSDEHLVQFTLQSSCEALTVLNRYYCLVC